MIRARVAMPYLVATQAWSTAPGGALVGGLIFVTLFEQPPADFSRNILPFILWQAYREPSSAPSPAASPDYY